MTITAHIEHDLAPDELAEVLCGLIRSERIEDPLAELLKSEPIREPQEHFIQGMVDSLTWKHQRAARAAHQNALVWLGGRSSVRGRRRLAKAEEDTDAAFGGHAPTHLSPEEITELTRLIAEHWTPELGGPGTRWSIPRATWQRWQALGVVRPGFQIPEIRDAFLSGRLYQVIEQGQSYEEMKRLAAQAPLGRAQRLALNWAEQNAAQHMTGFGVRMGQRAERALLAANRQQTRDLISQYLSGTLKMTRAAEGPPHDLLPIERAALTQDRTIKTWQQLASELRRQFEGTDPDRDWARLANTEVRLAHNAGRLAMYEEQRIPRLRAIVQPDACPACKALYLHPDGSPRIFTTEQIVRNFTATGGLNIGRKASLIGDPDKGWVASGGVIHPWCRCTLVPVL